MYSSCFGGSPEASGADVDVAEFIFLFFFFGVYFLSSVMFYVYRMAIQGLDVGCQRDKPDGGRHKLRGSVLWGFEALCFFCRGVVRYIPRLFLPCFNG